jgi:protein TonB
MKVSNERGPARTSVSSGFGASSAPLNGAEEKIPVIPASTSDSSFPEYVRKSGAIQPAQLITNVNPIYPEAAREVGVSGAVEVHFKIATTGNVQDVTVIKGPQILAQAAVDAVRQRKYKAARVDGVPTETDASAVFEFRLN